MINRVILLDLRSSLYVIFSIMAVAKSTGTMDLSSPYIHMAHSVGKFIQLISGCLGQSYPKQVGRRAQSVILSLLGRSSHLVVNDHG
jgi:hypothetical protein